MPEQLRDSAFPTGPTSSGGATNGDQPAWIDQVKAKAERDKRLQPWKEAFGKTHDEGASGEDLINLDLPNHVQCGSMAA